MTPQGGQISPLGLRFSPKSSGGSAVTTIPVMALGPPGPLVAERALAQTGLSIALASNVLQSQIEVLFTSGTAGNPCQALPGDGSAQSGSTPTTTVDGNPFYPITVYYDSSCTETYIAAKITSAANTGSQSGVLAETATYYGVNGTNLGTMTLNETLADVSDDIQVHGLGLFNRHSAPDARTVGARLRYLAQFQFVHSLRGGGNAGFSGAESGHRLRDSAST